MSDRQSDADLIRICLEGTAEDLTETVVSQISQRLTESALLRAAVSESPIAETINERLPTPVSADNVRKTSSPAGTSSITKLVVVVLIVGVLVGGSLWWSNQSADSTRPAVSSSEDSPPLPSDTESSSVETKGGQDDDLRVENTSTKQAVADSSSSTGDGSNVPPKDDTGSAAGAPAAETSNADDSGTKLVVTASSEVSKPAVDLTGPWTEALSLEIPPRRFEDVAWQVPGQDQPDDFPPKEFRQWFARVPGKPFQDGEEKSANRIFTSFNGIARFQAPWVDSAVLRIGLYDTERCTFTIWNGNRGVQLTFYRSHNPNIWGVYSVSRTGREGEDASPRIDRFLTSDSGRWHRSNFGIFDLRWDDGYLRMVRGDVVLLEVPFDGPPEEIVLDGKLKLRDVRMFRSDPLPEYIVQRSNNPQGQNILATDKLAELDWLMTEVPDGAFSKELSDGEVQLSTTSGSDKLALAFVKVPNAGLSEVVFRVGSIDPGTGIYFGRADGAPVFRISCVWDTAVNKPAFWFQTASQHEIERRFDSTAYVVPWTGPDQWIRVVVGYGITTVQMSPDGRNWGWIIDNPNRTDWEHIETIGIFTEPKGERQIRLSSISINEFPALKSVADPKLVSQINVPDLGPLNVLDVGAWLHRVTRLQPKDVAFGDWQRACAVATLRARPRAPLGIFLVNGLLADGAFSNSAEHSAERDIAWKQLNEAAQLVSPIDSNRAIQFQQLYHEVARRRVVEQHESDGTKPAEADDEIRPGRNVLRDTASSLLSSPMQTNQASALTAQTAGRLEVIALVQSGRHAEARQLIDEIVFWNSNAHPSREWWSPIDPLYPTLAWAELRAHAGLDSETQNARFTLPRRWKTPLTPERHPLAQPVSKEAYNVMAEFQAAVDGDAFQDACQVIASAGSANLIGLLPDSLDNQLLVAFPNAVAMAMDQYPQLRQQMNDRFGAIGRLRVRQAIENGDYRQVESATIQFFGTPAAAESDLWLGNRAASAGEFAQAREYFERAIAGFRKHSQIETSEVATATARLKVVNALLGDTPEKPAADTEARPVTFGSQQLSPQQFASLVTELSEARVLQNSAGTSLAQISDTPDGSFNVSRIPLPVVHHVENRGRYEGDLGEHVGRAVPADTDWVSRQLASTIVGDHAYLNNRFQVTCLDLTNGSTKWNQQLGGEHGSANHWPMLAMRPLVVGDSVFCRRLTKKGPEVVCCQIADGKVKWKQQLEQVFVSDPFLLRGHLQILATVQSTIGPTVLNLLTLHRETGNILSTAPVLKLFDAWQNSSLVCQVAVQDARFFVSTAGAVACCDAEGKTHWVRRREWTPAKIDSQYRYARSWSPPVIFGTQLIVGQPESPTIDCLDMRTGRLIWQHVEPELRRIISQFDDSLLVETRDGLKSVSAETGHTEWLHPAADLMDGVMVGPLESTAKPPPEDGDEPKQNFILAVRLIPNQEGRTNTAIPTLVWVHAATGQEIARQRLLSLADPEARVGPLLITKDHFFAFSGKNRKDGKRDIIELVPDPLAALSQPIDQELLAAWHPEFLVSTFPDNYAGRPKLTATLIQRDSRNGIDAFCPGWLIVAQPQPAGMGKRPDHRGQKDALELRLQPVKSTPEELQALADTPIGAIRLVRDIFIPTTGDHSFRIKAGNNPGQAWNLTIDANGQQIHSTVISDETAPSGWSAIHTSLQRWAGQSVRIVVTCSLSDAKKQTSVFLSEMNSSTLARPIPTN
jgi:hypothetical protein